MTCVTDEASDVETLWSEAAIRNAHIEAHRERKAFKACQFCGDPTEGGAEFCSYGPVSCAADAQWRNEIIGNRTMGGV